MSSNPLHLTNLPSDIIRKIIKTGVESIESAKLISRRWLAIAIKYKFANRQGLPVIDSLRWQVDRFGNSTLSMRVSDDLRIYFGVKTWRAMWIPWRRAYDPHIVQFRFDCSNILYEAEFVARRRRFLARFVRLLNRCSRIGQLELSMDFSERAEVDLINMFLSGITLDSLIIKPHEELRDKSQFAMILNLLRANRARALVIYCNREFTGISAESFLPEALNIVPKVDLKQEVLTQDEWNVTMCSAKALQYSIIIDSTGTMIAECKKEAELNGYTNICITVSAKQQ